MNYATERRMERSCDENGLKRRQSRRLGPWYVSFFFLSHFMTLTNILLCIYVLIHEIHDQERDRVFQ